jgi:hypothetical protein
MDMEVEDTVEAKRCNAKLIICAETMRKIHRCLIESLYICSRSVAYMQVYRLMYMCKYSRRRTSVDTCGQRCG